MKEAFQSKSNEVERRRQRLQDRHLLERKEEEERLRSKMEELERKRGLGAGRVLWQQLTKERELFLQRQGEEEEEFVVCKELECPVCLPEMLPPIRIWQCS